MAESIMDAWAEDDGACDAARVLAALGAR